jgi:cation diffusion facilitator CzcD-associated flavoprotein CzcO
VPAYDVLIVGAGFAGIHALHRFRSLGFNARVEEATWRLCRRIAKKRAAIAYAVAAWKVRKMRDGRNRADSEISL